MSTKLRAIHSLTLTIYHSNFKINKYFSQEQLGHKTKGYMKAHEKKEMTVYTNELGHIIKTAAMPIYGKNL